MAARVTTICLFDPATFPDDAAGELQTVAETIQELQKGTLTFEEMKKLVDDIVVLTHTYRICLKEGGEEHKADKPQHTVTAAQLKNLPWSQRKRNSKNATMNARARNKLMIKICQELEIKTAVMGSELEDAKEAYNSTNEAFLKAVIDSSATGPPSAATSNNTTVAPTNHPATPSNGTAAAAATTTATDTPVAAAAAEATIHVPDGAPPSGYNSDTGSRLGLPTKAQDDMFKLILADSQASMKQMHEENVQLSRQHEAEAQALSARKAAAVAEEDRKKEAAVAEEDRKKEEEKSIQLGEKRKLAQVESNNEKNKVARAHHTKVINSAVKAYGLDQYISLEESTPEVAPTPVATLISTPAAGQGSAPMARATPARTPQVAKNLFFAGEEDPNKKSAASPDDREALVNQEMDLSKSPSPSANKTSAPTPARTAEATSATVLTVNQPKWFDKNPVATKSVIGRFLVANESESGFTPHDFDMWLAENGGTKIEGRYNSTLMIDLVQHLNIQNPDVFIDCFRSEAASFISSNEVSENSVHVVAAFADFTRSYYEVEEDGQMFETPLALWEHVADDCGIPRNVLKEEFRSWPKPTKFHKMTMAQLQEEADKWGQSLAGMGKAEAVAAVL